MRLWVSVAQGLYRNKTEHVNGDYFFSSWLALASFATRFTMVCFMLAAAFVYSRLWNAYKHQRQPIPEVSFYKHGDYMRRECLQVRSGAIAPSPSAEERRTDRVTGAGAGEGRGARGRVLIVHLRKGARMHTDTRCRSRLSCAVKVLASGRRLPYAAHAPTSSLTHTVLARGHRCW